jgi:hypothetical protein
MRIHETTLPGRRILRAASFTMAGDDEPRLVIWTAFSDDPPLPLTAHAISFPASELPALIEALSSLKGGEK